MEELELHEYGGTERGDSLFIYAGTPDGIPDELLKTDFGFLNKQLSFANWDKEDVENIIEDIRIDFLHTITRLKRYQLRGLSTKHLRQKMIIAKGLASLGKDGFLIRQATTSRREITQARMDENRGGFFKFFRR